MSIMCHRAKVLDYSTFRLNLTCTTPYNADFDGDEMNMHALQTLPAIAEASELMIVPRLIITPAASRPVMGIVQDTLLGSRKINMRDVFVEKPVFFNLLTWAVGWDGKVPQPAILLPDKKRPGRPRPLWTGKQVYSLIIPNVNYKVVKGDDADNDPAFKGAPGKRAGEDFKLWPGDSSVLVQRGQLLMGILDKSPLGNKAQSILHLIMNDATPEDCRDFINNAQKLVNYWLLHRGFSVGVGDAESDTRTLQKVQDGTREAKRLVKRSVAKLQKGELLRQPGQTLMQAFEGEVNTILNSARDTATKAVLESLTEHVNAVLGMYMAGSKGSDTNISQIIALVGQQNVSAKRIAYGFKDRTLPHFSKFGLGPEERGFVANSYLAGLTPLEFFFHMMGGREGLIDTAVKTAETGYIQRRLVKAMEDVMVRYDGTVRNAQGEVLQFLYGEDGMDGRWIEKQSLPSYAMSRKALREEYGWDTTAPDFGRAPKGAREEFLDPDVAADMRANAETEEALKRELAQLEADRAVLFGAAKKANSVPDGHECALPVNAERLLWNAKNAFGIRPDRPSDLHPVADVIEPLAALIKRCRVVPNPTGEDRLAAEAQDNATALFGAMLRSTLASKKVIAFHRLTREAFNYLLGQIEARWFSGIAAAGEMCGVVAAQSIGEPATQMTLNTFHLAGVQNKQTQGVPRLKELINVARRVGTPSITIYCAEDEDRRDRDKALPKLRAALEHLTLGELVEATSIVYDPDPLATVVPEDADLVEANTAAPVLPEADPVNLSPWVLRVVLVKERFVARKEFLSMKTIRSAIVEKYGGAGDQLEVISSEDNDEHLMLRIRVHNSPAAAMPENQRASICPSR